MSPHQIDLIQNSWRAVVPIQDTAARLFYQKLFEIDPPTRDLFSNDMAVQGQKLMKALGFIVNALPQLDTLVPVAQDMAKRHVGYGVLAEQYDSVGAALLWALEQGLGSVFTDEVKEAWTMAYSTLSEVMIDAAYKESSG